MIGFRNPESPIETDALLPEEVILKQTFEDIGKDIHDVRNRLHYFEMKKSLMQLRCPHPVFLDRYNDPHDHRVCVICGKSMGMI